MFDPEAFKRQQAFGALAAFGQGLAALGNRNPQGVQASIQGMQTATDPGRLMQARYLAAQMQSQQQQQAARQQEMQRKAEAQRMMSGLLSGSATGAGGAAPVPSLGPMAQASLAMMDPEKAADALFDLSTRQPKAPGMLVQDASGNWVANPAYVDARKQIAAAGAPTVNVSNMPKLAVGERVVRDDAGNVIGVEAVPGSQLDIERQGAAKMEAAAQEAKEQQADIVVEDIDRALQLESESLFPVTGIIGTLGKVIPGTPQADTAALLETIGANIGFDRLQRMREQSPTGGALGNITDDERKALQSTQGALEQSQGGPQFRYNLIRLRNQYLDTIHGVGNGPPRLPLPSTRQAPGADASVDDVLEFYK